LFTNVTKSESSNGDSGQTGAFLYIIYPWELSNCGYENIETGFVPPDTGKPDLVNYY